MKNGSKSERISERHSIIVLCEGKHEVKLTSKLIGGSARIIEGKQNTKYFKINDLLDKINMGLSNYIVVVDEGGVERFLYNIRSLISKLRTILAEKNIEKAIFIGVADADSPQPSNRFNRLKRDIESLINNPQRFRTISKPAIEFIEVKGHLFKINVKYRNNTMLEFILLLIPGNLEDWVEKREYNTIGRLMELPWFKTLMDILRQYGVLRDDINNILDDEPY